MQVYVSNEIYPYVTGYVIKGKLEPHDLWLVPGGVCSSARGGDINGPHLGVVTAQYSTVQYSTVQYSTVQYST